MKELLVNFDHHKFLVEVYHEKMDLIGKKIHKIMFHLPINLIYDNQEMNLVLVDMLKSFQRTTLFFFIHQFKSHTSGAISARFPPLQISSV